MEALKRPRRGLREPGSDSPRLLGRPWISLRPAPPALRRGYKKLEELHGGLTAATLLPPQGAWSAPDGVGEGQNPRPGGGDIPGCGCGLHSGGVAPLVPSPEGAVQGGNAGECPEPALCG
ncbi:uncharacterized protein LOC103103987 isoform X4 [Monodelphis domestica]|uniref:uncharacterized protein LOC103103987 isoform X4 n=1 Tax=Monodelphis domestica TaxID=13616 RepID=UPI0024E25FC6|nr:uncharacterized protein LOC103103987 isoform X4 [Monodelphis domestica]